MQFCCGITSQRLKKQVKGTISIIYNSGGWFSPKPVSSSASTPMKCRSIVEMIERGNKNAVFFYGSQTGTAEDYASRFCKDCERLGLRGLLADLDDYDMEDLANIPSNIVVGFFLATYGEGEPTDNCQIFWNLIMDKDCDLELNNLKFIVFGLGNTTYEHFNAVARKVSSRLVELGSKMVGDLGLGDDSKSLEDDFLSWKENIFAKLCEEWGLEESTDSVLPSRVYKYALFEDSNCVVYKGEISTSKKKSYDSKHPYYAAVKSREILTQDKEKVIYKVEFDLADSGIQYKPGDHLAVFPKNDPVHVRELCQVLGLNPTSIFSMTAIDPTASRRNPFPCPCSFETALSHYLDIETPPSCHIIKAMSEFASNEKEKEFLAKISVISGRDLYHKYVIEERRTIKRILEENPSVHIPWDLLFEMMSRLQCRYYSISSSQRLHPSSVCMTASLIEYSTPLGVTRKGVCSNFLFSLDLTCLEKVPIYIRQSNFKLPRKHLEKPFIMIGPGTGVAPYISFIEERMFLMSQKDSSEITPKDSYLFYGCRSDLDYCYKSFFEDAIKCKALTEVFVAFSRKQKEKVYVQHLISQRAELVRKVLNDEEGYLYICGDATNMARDVHAVLLEILGEDCLKKIKGDGRYLEDIWT